MKKILAVFPIIVILIIGNMAALTARAADQDVFTNYVVGKAYDEIDLIKNEDVALKSLYEDCHSPENYLVFQAVYLYNQMCMIQFHMMYSDSNFVIEEDNGIYTITSTGRIYDKSIQNEWNASGATITSFRQGSFGSSDVLGNSGLLDTEFVFDSKECTLKYNANGSERDIFLNYTKNSPMYVLTDFASSRSLDLSVSFTPSLSGEIDRTIEQNGVQAESNYFSMNITNNSDINAQFLMAIVPTGATTFFCGNTDIDVGVKFSDSPIYYLMYKEWVYSPKITGSIAGQFKAFEEEYYQSSSWHIVSGNSTYTRQFNWQQINIKAGVSYDVVVVAIPTDFSKPSNVFSQSACDHYLDSSSGEEVYRSTFTVPNPATYDSTNTEFGNLSGVPVAELNKADGYIDDNGDAVIEDISASGLLEDRGTWEPGIITKDYADFSFEDVGSLLSQSTSFFNFLAVVFTFMPFWFWVIFAFGITALVIIAIVKAIL